MSNDKREDELRRSIAAMIDEVYSYCLMHPFLAIDVDAFAGDFVDLCQFTTGESAIDPRVAVDNKRFDEFLQISGSAIPRENEQAHYAHIELDALRSSIASGTAAAGYYFGILMGARLMGGSREDLERLGEGLYRTLLAKISAD